LAQGGAHLNHVDGLDDAGGEHAGGAAVGEGLHRLPHAAARRGHLLLLLRLRHLRCPGLVSPPERRGEVVGGLARPASLPGNGTNRSIGTLAAVALFAVDGCFFMVRGPTDVGQKWISRPQRRPQRMTRAGPAHENLLFVRSLPSSSRACVRVRTREKGWEGRGDAGDSGDDGAGVMRAVARGGRDTAAALGSGLAPTITTAQWAVAKGRSRGVTRGTKRGVVTRKINEQRKKNV
jgi:hypothetical protein